MKRVIHFPNGGINSGTNPLYLANGEIIDSQNLTIINNGVFSQSELPHKITSLSDSTIHPIIALPTKKLTMTPGSSTAEFDDSIDDIYEN